MLLVNYTSVIFGFIDNAEKAERIGRAELKLHVTMKPNAKRNQRTAFQMLSAFYKFTL